MIKFNNFIKKLKNIKIESDKIAVLILTIAILSVAFLDVYSFATHKDTKKIENEVKPTSTTVKVIETTTKEPPKKMEVSIDGYGTVRGMRLFIVDTKTRKPVNAVPEIVEFEILSPDHKKKIYKDDDKNGVLVIQNLKAGSYKISVKSNDKMHFNNDVLQIVVKEKVEYKPNKKAVQLVKKETGKEKDAPIKKVEKRPQLKNTMDFVKSYAIYYEKATPDLSLSKADESDDDKPLKDKDNNLLYKDVTDVQADANYPQAYISDYEKNPKANYYKKLSPARYFGWQKINNRVHYFDKNGKPANGYQVIEHIAYNFDKDGALMYSNCIDVSRWQGEHIDFDKVKAAGYTHVIIRIGFRGYAPEGNLKEDIYAKLNIQKAKKANLNIALYFFSQAVNEEEGKLEADFATQKAKEYGLSPSNTAIFIDSESSGAAGYSGRADKISKKSRTEAVNSFMKMCHATGYKTGVYASKSWFTSNLDVSTFPSYANLWVAYWPSGKIPESISGFPYSYQIWQITSDGKVDGINGRVDVNRWYYLK
ncbi:MAG: GH25 family lysozyme [Clostridia bacterium]|nr:GH25 family lysozyme [Clostridia bacterium]